MTNPEDDGPHLRPEFLPVVRTIRARIETDVGVDGAVMHGRYRRPAGRRRRVGAGLALTGARSCQLPGDGAVGRIAITSISTWKRSSISPHTIVVRAGFAPPKASAYSSLNRAKLSRDAR